MISKQKVSLLVLVPLCHCVSQDLGKRGSWCFPKCSWFWWSSCWVCTTSRLIWNLAMSFMSQVNHAGEGHTPALGQANGDWTSWLMKCPRFVWTVLRKFPLLTRLAAFTQPPWDSKRRTACQCVLPGQLVGAASSCGEPCLGAFPGLNCWHSLHQQWARGKFRLSLLCAALFTSPELPPSRFYLFGLKLETLHIAFCCPWAQFLCPSSYWRRWRLKTSMPLSMWVTSCHQDLWW